MPKYLVRFQVVTDGGVWVDVDDLDDAWDAAYNKLPTLCSQCAGMGRSGWFMELGDDKEFYAVETEDGTEVATDKTHIDYLQDQITRLQAEVKRLKNVF